jgi:hypothetical protein
MIELLFAQWFESLIDTVGSPELAVFVIMFLLFLGMLYAGLEVDLALIVLSPLPYAFYKATYLEVWITALFIIIPLGVGIYMVWLRFSQR